MAASLIVAFVTAVRSTSEFPFLPFVIAGVGGITLAAQLLRPTSLLVSRVASWSLVGTILLGPILWSIATATTPHVGAGVIAGPSILGVRTDHPDRYQLAPDLPASVAVVMFGDRPSPIVVKRVHDA